MNLATLDVKASDVCHARLRESIMDADLLPNSHHMESSIAQRLGYDQPLVHDAALRLHREGLVSVEPRGGFWVAPLAPSEVVDAFQQVSMLEARAAFVAALHSPSSIGMAALDDSVLRMEDALYRLDLDRWARANHHFHRSIVQCSGHTGLIGAALPLSESIHRARMLTLRLGPLPVEATQDHGRVVEAIRRGLATDARDIHLASWRSASRRIVLLLENNRLDRMTA
mgnify:CR=1 FL=1